MSDTGIVTGAQLTDRSVSVKQLFSRLNRKLQEYVRCKQSSSTTYHFTHPRRGLAIIISNGKFLSQEPRPYANVEIAHMQTVFKKLFFDVLSFQDLTKKQMLSVLEYASKLKEFHHQSDCFACVIGSHGAEIPSGLNKQSAPNKKHVIFGTDEHVDTNRLTDLFSDSNCPGLRHKPKLFFIQACRGDSKAPPDSGIDIGVDINITSGQHLTSSRPPIFALYEPRGTPTRGGEGRLGSATGDDTVEGGLASATGDDTVEGSLGSATGDDTVEGFSSSKTEIQKTDMKYNKDSDRKETPPNQAKLSNMSPKENNKGLSPEGNGMGPALQDTKDTTSPALQDHMVESLTEDTVSGTSLKDGITEPREMSGVNEAYNQRPTDQLEFRNALSRFLLLKPFVDEQVSPVCSPNFMIMYSSPQDMFSFGRPEDGGMARVRNPVVGGLMLHSLYTVVVRENVFVRQRTQEGLDMLDLFTLVSDFGLKNILATIELPVGTSKEDKKKICVKCAFAVEHRLVDDVVFRNKDET